nr:MAG TPA: hypothetical protein [Caudoviricetes sp.]
MLCSILRFMSWLLNRIIASVQNHGSIALPTIPTNKIIRL